jgi:hypothetical protein
MNIRINNLDNIEYDDLLDLNRLSTLNFRTTSIPESIDCEVSIVI